MRVFGDPSGERWSRFVRRVDMALGTGRKAARYDNIMSFARHLRKQDPTALGDLVLLLGRELQYRQMALPLCFSDWRTLDYLEVYWESPWFSPSEPLTTANERFFDLVGRPEPTRTVDLSRDLVLVHPWSETSYRGLLHTLGTGRPFGAWEQRPTHYLVLYEPVGLSIVIEGKHSTAVGILRGEGKLWPRDVFDIRRVYEHVGCDGKRFYRFCDGRTLGPVRDVKLAAIFEVGRLIADAQAEGRIPV